MRREHRRVRRVVGQPQAQRFVALRVGDVVAYHHPVQHLPPAVIHRLLHVRVGVERVQVSRRLRQARQQRRLAERELADVLAEQRLRGRLRAVGQVAIVDFVQVQRQNFRLAAPLRQQYRQQNFLDLALRAALRAIGVVEQHVTHQLLRDRAAAGRVAGAAQVLQEGAAGRLQLEAGVRPEAIVFDGDGRVDQVDRELLVLDVSAPALAEGFVQQLAGAVIKEGALEVAVVVDAGDLRLELFFQPRAERGRQQQRNQRQAAAERHEHADEHHEAAGRAAENLALACALARRQLTLAWHGRAGLDVLRRVLALRRSLPTGYGVALVGQRILLARCGRRLPGLVGRRGHGLRRRCATLWRHVDHRVLERDDVRHGVLAPVRFAAGEVRVRVQAAAAGQRLPGVVAAGRVLLQRRRHRRQVVHVGGRWARLWRARGGDLLVGHRRHLVGFVVGQAACLAELRRQIVGRVLRAGFQLIVQLRRQIVGRRAGGRVGRFFVVERVLELVGDVIGGVTGRIGAGRLLGRRFRRGRLLLVELRGEIVLSVVNARAPIGLIVRPLVVVVGALQVAFIGHSVLRVISYNAYDSFYQRTGGGPCRLTTACRTQNDRLNGGQASASRSV